MLAAGMTACGKKNGPAPPVTPPDTTGKTPVQSQVALWLTNTDKSALFQRQNVALDFGTGPAVQPVITVDTTQTYQTIDGFGYALTGGSAQLIYSLPTTQRLAASGRVERQGKRLDPGARAVGNSCRDRFACCADISQHRRVCLAVAVI